MEFTKSSNGSAPIAYRWSMRSTFPIGWWFLEWLSQSNGSHGEPSLPSTYHQQKWLILPRDYVNNILCFSVNFTQWLGEEMAMCTRTWSNGHKTVSLTGQRWGSQVYTMLTNITQSVACGLPAFILCIYILNSLTACRFCQHSRSTSSRWWSTRAQCYKQILWRYWMNIANT